MAVADRTLQILPGGQSAAPFSYVLPASTSFDLLAIRATFDGTSAAGAYLPCVQLISDAGVLMAQTVGSSVAAGASADVTFAPFLDDGTTTAGCCATDTSTYGTVVDQLVPAAWWKFNESAGNTAADSSGNGWDLNVVGVGPLAAGNWTWAQPGGPPGDQSAFCWGGGPNASNGLFPALVDNWAAASWVNIHRLSFLVPAIMGQGDPPASPGAGGWYLHCVSGPNTFQLIYSDGVNSHYLDSTVSASQDVWYLAGVQRENGVFSIWVNGAITPGVLAATFAGHTGVRFGLDNAGGFYMGGSYSWSFIFPRPLTAGEWASLYAPGGSIPAGWLLTATGTGSSTYAPLSSAGATAGWTLHADGSGGVYWAP